MSETFAAVEASAVALGPKVAAVSGVGSFVGFVTKIDPVGWGGLFVAVVGLAAQLYFSIARNRREKVEHELKKAEYRLRIENLKEECNAEQD